MVGCYECTTSSYCVTCMIGYQLNPSNAGCSKIPCLDSHCTLCTISTTCSQCDYLNSYYLTAGTCQLCNAAANMFINITDPTYPCLACTPANCQVCSSLTSCSVCMQANGYFANPGDSLCYLCSATISNCQTCSGYLICQVCSPPFVLNSTSAIPNGQCIPCPLLGCATCLDINTCQTCDYNASYGILPSLTCQLCDPSIQ